jgi:MFS transporter, FHS family, L-fucose permease
LPNNLTDILVQQFKKSFELSPLEAQLVQTANFLGYFCMAIPAGLLMRRWGYKAGIITGLCLFGGGTLLFLPAAIIGHYGPFLLALFVVGCGSATLETAANPFIAQFGPPETSERRLNFSQAFNPPGGIAGVLIGTYAIFSGVELSNDKVASMKAAGTYLPYLHGEMLRVVPTYVGLGVLVLLWALWIGLTKFPIVGADHNTGDDTGSFSRLFRYPNLWFAVIAQFCYCGAQVSTWSAFIPYVKQYTTFPERKAALFLIANLTVFGIGRWLSTGLMRRFRPARMTALYAVLNMVLLAAGVLHPGMVGACAILTTNLFMSIMFPTIFAMGLRDLGPDTKLGGSVLIMSVIGAAIVPLLLGWVTKTTGSYALGYAVPAVAYIAVALYGFMAQTEILKQA